MPFDPNRDYGKVCGSEPSPQGPGGVAFQQNDCYYNQHGAATDEHGNMIEEPKVKPKADKPKGEPIAEARALIGQADKMSFFAFTKAAKELLGPGMPTLKNDIISALKGLTKAKPKAPAGEKPAAPAKANGAGITLKNGTTVDLVGWGDKRVNKNYLFGDVRAALRQGHNRQVDNERDAMNFLIEEGLVQAEFARNVG